MDVRMAEAAEARHAIQEHLSGGAVVHVPSEPGRRGKVVGLLSTLMVAGVMTTAMASTPVHDDLKVADALNAPQAQKSFVLELDPAAPATPETLAQLYTTLEAATLAQFPEMRGKFAVYNPFNDPQAEEARIAGMLNAPDPLKDIHKRREEGFTGGQATPVATANGYGCVALGWAHDPNDPVALGTHAHVAVHESMHCADPEFYAKTTGWSPVDAAANRNHETVAQIAATDWELTNGAPLTELTREVARRWYGTSGNKDVRYDAGDDFYALQSYHQGHQGEGLKRLDFSNLAQSLGRALKIRDAHREDARSIHDREEFDFALSRVQAHFEEKGDQASIRAFLEENKDIAFLNKARLGAAYLEAEQTGAPLPDLSQGIGADPLADQTYARWQLKEMNGTMSEADRVFAKSLEMWIDGAFTVRGLPDVDGFTERVQTDRAYAEAVASGEISVLAGAKVREGKEQTYFQPGPLTERFATEAGSMPDLALKAAAFLRDSEGDLTREQRMEARAAGLVFKEIAATGGAPAAKVEKVMQTLESVQNLVAGELGAQRLDDAALRNLATWAVKDAPVKSASHAAGHGER